ncbi:MAG TPA: PDZ domain-containing protein [Actinomycetota bacterium]
MRNVGYFRRPTVNGDTVVIVCEDDLWSVPLGGGVARRLTAGRGPVTSPALSPDGSWIAYSSQDEMHLEVYVMPANGGETKRLTYLGANSVVAGWTPDGSIVFRTDARQPFVGRISWLHTVPPGGGEPERIPFGQGHDVAYGSRGRVALGRWTLDPAQWKRYRGGRVGRIWVDAGGKGRFKQLASFGGNLASPMWAGDRLFFISDHEGIGNIYSCTPAGAGLRRHSDHGEYYARFARTDGSTIVYQHAAELWVLGAAAGEPRRIEVEFPSPRTQRHRKFADAAGYLHGAALHPAGHSIAIETRGRAYAMPLWEGPTREVGNEPATRYRLPAWLNDGERIVVVSDAGGEETLEVHKPGARPKRLAGLDLGRVVRLAPAPKGELVAIANHRNELLLVDLKAKTARVADSSPHGGMTGIAWSADGSWLAYAAMETRRVRAIRLVEASGGAPVTVTHPTFNDHSPTFDPEGRYLYFLSLRSFDPVVDSHFFDLNFPRASKPYALALRADVPSPFVSEPKGFGETGDSKDDKTAAKKDAGKKDAEPLRVDLDGIADRVEAFPVPLGRYGQVVAIKGKALFTERPVQGLLGVDRRANEPPSGKLQVYDFAEQKHETLVEGVGEFIVSADGSTLLYAAGTRLRALKAGTKPDQNAGDAPGKASGWIDLDRVRVSIEPAGEWRQMFAEAWRLQTQHFWTPDMSKVDWRRVYERYLPLVDKVATRLEFSDLMWEMQGELGTSHAYDMGGDHRKPPAYTMGFLGADVDYDDGVYRISHVVRGDPWDPEGTSPLLGMGANVRPGDTILAVNGRAVSEATPPAALLVNQAGQRVELTIGDAAGKKPRAVVVKTLRSEVPARYRDWVEANRAAVHAATRRRAGYLHIPNMGADGYAEFHRSFLEEMEHDALIVDVRHNGGGFVSQLVLEKLARKPIAYALARWGTPDPYPEDSPRGPLVCLTDENAGSDGDIFTHCFKLLKLGPVVGKRTWGGVIGISPKHRLADNGITTQPEYSFWFTDVGWGVENYGTDPDYDVDNTPQDHAAGRDAQLEKGLELIKAALKASPPKRPDFSKRPSRALPTLPKRR